MPLLAGRAHAIQPRSLEYLENWGLVSEIAEEGPLLNHTAMFKNGTKMFYGPSFVRLACHQSGSDREDLCAGLDAASGSGRAVYRDRQLRGQQRARMLASSTGNNQAYEVWKTEDCKS